MVSNRCKMAVKEELKKLGLHFIVVDLGEVEIMENISVDQREQLRMALLTSGLELIDNHKAVLIEKIRAIVVDMTYNSKGRIKTNFSDYLTEKLNYDYTYLSKLFSEVQGITIEQLIIMHKIELIKELIMYGELTITEIAWKLNYSSVAHLSNQFKKVTGYSPSHFKKLKDKRRNPIEDIGKPIEKHSAVSLHDTPTIPLLDSKKIEDSQYARILMEASSDPLVTLSAEGKITDMNEATLHITGITREFLVGTDFFVYFTNPEKVREVYKEVFTKGSVADMPLTLRHINGKLTDVLCNGSIYKDGQGIVQGAVIVARDGTQQKGIATELAEAIVFAENATLNAEEARIEAESVSTIAKEGIKVLVAEDIELNQLLMRTRLEDFGFECDIVGNGKLAVEKLQTKKYDVVLMDLHMPEMNGFEATGFIRNVLKSDIPIIALTAGITAVDLAKCTAVGMNDYIAKPVNERLLYSKIIGKVNKTSSVHGVGLAMYPQGIICNYTNLEYLNTRTKSNPALMVEMISLYLEQTPHLIEAMRQSYKDKNWDKLYITVHKLIPSFSIMGIGAEFEKMAQQVQDFATSQLEFGEIPEMIQQLEKVLMQSCDELQEELKQLKSQKDEHEKKDKAFSS